MSFRGMPGLSAWVQRLMVVALLWMAAPVFAQGTAALALGAAAPEFSLPGVDGKVHQLKEYAGSKVLVVAFLCNHCVESQRYEDRMERLAEGYRSKGVAVVGIEAGNPDAVPMEQLAYTDVGDGLADMKERATSRHLTFPYLYDGESQRVTRLYGATVAPQIFVFDQARRLRYEGRFDDSPEEAQVKRSDVREAVDALLAGQPVAEAQTTASGCALQGSAQAVVRAEREKADAEPVTVALAGPEDLKKLRANEAGKMLLVNFYATWCGPCVSEFPDLMATSRMYRGRGLVLTTVSSNEPEERPDVLKFLQKMHASTTTNLLFGTTDTYALQAAFDPNMGAGVPFTVLIAPDGEILYQETGELDMMKLRRAILANLPEDKAHEGSHAYWNAK